MSLPRMLRSYGFFGSLGASDTVGDHSSAAGADAPPGAAEPDAFAGSSSASAAAGAAFAFADDADFGGGSASATAVSTPRPSSHLRCASVILPMGNQVLELNRPPCRAAVQAGLVRPAGMLARSG